MNPVTATLLSLSLISGACLQAATEDFSGHPEKPFTALKSPVGLFKAFRGDATIDYRSADEKRGSLHIKGGPSKLVSLHLAPELRSVPLRTLSFHAERWTAIPPFSFRIEARQGRKWTLIYRGDDLQRGALKEKITVDLRDQHYQTFRFIADTPDHSDDPQKDSGVILDKIEVTPAPSLRLQRASRDLSSS